MPEGFGDASFLIFTLIETSIPKSFLVYQNLLFLNLMLCTPSPSSLFIPFLYAPFHAAQFPLYHPDDFGCLVRLNFSVCFYLLSFRCQIVLPLTFAMHCLACLIFIPGPHVLRISYFYFVGVFIQWLPTPHRTLMYSESLKRMRWGCVYMIGEFATPALPQLILCCAGEYDLSCCVVIEIIICFNVPFQCFLINIFECFCVKCIMLCTLFDNVTSVACWRYLLGVYFDCLTVTLIDILSKPPAKG